MRRVASVIGFVVAAVLFQPHSANAQPRPSWDSRGWMLLGETTVNGHGRVDTDQIRVGAYEGRFKKLNIVVEEGEFELVDFGIRFADGYEYKPSVGYMFREGQRTRTVDLPPGERVISLITFRYRNLTDGGHARIGVWGFKIGDNYVPPPAPVRVDWDSRGWIMLGERVVSGHGRIDHDRIEVGRQEGKFNKLTLVVQDSDLEMVDFTISFGGGQTWRPSVSHFFREGQRTRVIDFPESEWGHDNRSIRNIDFAYRNVPGEGHARVQVWAQRGYEAPPPIHVDFDSRGWVLLGERAVNGHGRLDHDRIEVGRQEGKFNKLTLVVQDSDLEMVDFTITFGGGQTWRPSVSHYFRENQRIRVIDFPESAWGNDNRSIHAIDFTYRNIPGGGRSRVQVYAQRGYEAPPAPAFDNRGWIMLGETVVNGHGREDRDRVTVGRGEGKFSRLTIVVTDGDLELIDLSVQFRRGAPFHPATNHYFREGQRSRVVEFPPSDYGNTTRTIEYIDFTYRNLPGGGHARVQVWAK